MKKPEFKKALNDRGMNYMSFAILIGYDQNSVSRWGRNGEDVPTWAVLLIQCITERGSWRDLYNRNR